MDPNQQETPPPVELHEPNPVPTSQPEPEPPKNNRKKVLTIAAIVVALLLFGAAVVWLLQSLQGLNQTETTKEQETSRKPYLTYTNLDSTDVNQLYRYDPVSNESQVYLELAKGEHVSVSPDGTRLARTKGNVLEVADATEKPEFKQIYTDSNPDAQLAVTWLSDGSGFTITTSAKTQGSSVTEKSYSVTHIQADGSDQQKLIDYPATLGTLTVESVDVARDEIYYSVGGEMGMQVKLGIAKLSDGTKVREYNQGFAEQPYAVANGKAYRLDGATGQRITQINLDNGEEKTIYETQAGDSIRTIKASADGTTLYFDQIDSGKPETKLKALNLSDNQTKDVYTPDVTAGAVQATTLTATPSSVVAEVSAADTAKGEALGNQYVYIDLTSPDYKWQVMQKTAYNKHLGEFAPLQLPQ